MDVARASIPELLQHWQSGDAQALHRLLPLIYADLRRIAAGALRGVNAPGATLQTTELVHELLLRVLKSQANAFETPAHLLNACARMMRQILVSRARAGSAEKRGGCWLRSEFQELVDLPIPDRTDLIALDEALAQLEQADARMSQVVELRYFAGLTMADIAQVLALDERTIQRDWAMARGWLKQRLDPVVP